MSEPSNSACGPCAARPRPSATTSPSILGATEELMRALMERNGLEPADFVSVILTCTDDLNAQFPAVGARAVGLDQVPLLCNRELDVPGAMERVIRVLAHYYAPADRTARARLPRRDAGAARRPALARSEPMSVQFAHKLAAIPGYVAGAPAGKAPESIADEGIAQLASNESPFGPHPAVAEAIARAAARREPLPGPERGAAAAADRRALRGRARPASRSPTAPARSCWRRRWRSASRAPSSSTPGPRSRSTRTWRRSRARARSASPLGRRRRPRPRRDRRPRSPPRPSWSLICNPNNPTSTHLPAARIAEFCERVPDHVTVLVDEAYVEFQLDDDPDASVDLRRDFPNLVLLRTFTKVYGLAGLRVGYALCSPKFRAAVDAVRQPFSVNALAQAAAAEAIRHQDDVADRVERNLVERVTVEEGVRELGLETPDSQANFSWIALGDARRGGDRRGARRARDPRPPGDPARRPGPHPGQLRHPGREPPLPDRAG